MDKKETKKEIKVIDKGKDNGNAMDDCCGKTVGRLR